MTMRVTMVGAYQLGLPVRLTLTGTRDTRFAADRDSCFSFSAAAALAGLPERLGADFFDWATWASSLAGRLGIRTCCRVRPTPSLGHCGAGSVGLESWTRRAGS